MILSKAILLENQKGFILTSISISTSSTLLRNREEVPTLPIKSVKVKEECNVTSNISSQGATAISVHRYPRHIHRHVVEERASPCNHGKVLENDQYDTNEGYIRRQGHECV